MVMLSLSPSKIYKEMEGETLEPRNTGSSSSSGSKPCSAESAREAGGSLVTLHCCEPCVQQPPV